GGAFKAVWSQIPHAHGVGVYVMSLAILAVGAGAAFAIYKPASADSLQSKAPGAFAALAGLQKAPDAGYVYYVAKVQQRFALLLNYVDLIGISGFVVRGAAGVAGLVGLVARALHTGNL